MLRDVNFSNLFYFLVLYSAKKENRDKNGMTRRHFLKKQKKN